MAKTSCKKIVQRHLYLVSFPVLMEAVYQGLVSVTTSRIAKWVKTKETVRLVQVEHGSAPQMDDVFSYPFFVMNLQIVLMARMSPVSVPHQL